MNKKIYRYESNPIVAVDWEREYGLMCMDTDTFVFIPSTDMFDNVVVIYEGEDEYDIADVLRNCWGVEYTLYKGEGSSLELVGFVLSAEAYESCDYFVEEDNE